MAKKIEGTIELVGWNFAFIPIDITLDSSVTHLAHRVYTYLVWRGGKKEVAWPGVQLMADEIGVSEISVKRALQNLVKQNWIFRHRRIGTSSKTFVFKSQDECAAFKSEFKRNRSYHQ